MMDLIMERNRILREIKESIIDLKEKGQKKEVVIAAINLMIDRVTPSDDHKMRAIMSEDVFGIINEIYPTEEKN